MRSVHGGGHAAALMTKARMFAAINSDPDVAKIKQMSTSLTHQFTHAAALMTKSRMTTAMNSDPEVGKVKQLQRSLTRPDRDSKMKGEIVKQFVETAKDDPGAAQAASTLRKFKSNLKRDPNLSHDPLATGWHEKVANERHGRGLGYKVKKLSRSQRNMAQLGRLMQHILPTGSRKKVLGKTGKGTDPVTGLNLKGELSDSGLGDWARKQKIQQMKQAGLSSSQIKNILSKSGKGDSSVSRLKQRLTKGLKTRMALAATQRKQALRQATCG